MSDTTSSVPPTGEPSPSPTPSPPPPPPPPPPGDTSSSTTGSPTGSTSSTRSTSSSPTQSSSSSTSSTTEDDDTSSTTSSTSSTPTIETTEDTTPTISTPSTASPSGPAVVTSFRTVTSNKPPNVSPTSTIDAEGGNSFFQNTGAVAGVFSVVGLIVLALLIAFITTGIRRRRAKKFDREIEAAAREAAAAQPPVGFLDDDDDDPEGRYNRGYSGGSGGAVGGAMGAAYGGGGGGAYSDVSSHGTFNQPPMSHHTSSGEAYNMREIGSGAPPSTHSAAQGHMSISPGEVFDYTAVAGGAAGAAGIGVARARSMKGANANYGQALQDGSTPYAAFSAPPMPSTSPGPNGNRRNTGGYDSSRGMDILEAAGMGAHLSGAGAASLARGPSVQYQQQAGAGLDRHKSLTSSSVYSSGSGGAASSSSQQQPSYYGGDYPPMPQQQQGGYSDYPAYPQQRQAAIQEADDDDDAYGGYVVDDPSPPVGQYQPQRQSAALPNPFDASKGPEVQPESVDDGPRVLKVANQ